MMHNMIIFCNQNDQVANTLFRHLQRENQPVTLITSEELVFAHWKHTINSAGISKTEIILPNGSLINSRNLKAVFNRIRVLPLFQFANTVDRNYAEMEMFALFVSFLKGINHLLVNPVQTRSMTNQEDNELQLKMLAVQAGFPVTDYHFSSAPRWQSEKELVPFAPEKKNSFSHYKRSPSLVWENKPVLFKEAFDEVTKIIVVGDVIIGEEAPEFTPSVKNLATSIGTPYFELQMVHTKYGWKLDAINCFPLFADQPVIQALAELLKFKSDLNS